VTRGPAADSTVSQGLTLSSALARTLSLRDHRLTAPIQIAILIAVTFLVYANTLQNQFVWDDDQFIVNNPAIRSLHEWPRYFYDPHTHASSNYQFYIYRPLRTLTYAIDYALWKLNPGGYHLTNVMLHCLAVLMAYVVARMIFGNNLLAFIVALLFGLHPVQTEAVAWVKGRDDILCALFYFAAFGVFLSAQKQGLSARHIWLIGLLYVLALLSKAMAITLPLILFVYQIIVRRAGSLSNSGNSGLRQYLILYLALGIAAIGFFILRSTVTGRVGQTGWLGGTFGATMLTMLPALAHYLKLLVFPLHLNADYYGFPVSTTFFEPRVIISLAVLFVVAGGAVICWRRLPLVTFGVLWIGITLLPVSNTIPTMQFVAERFLYLPMFGFCVVLVELFAWGYSRAGVALRTVLVGLLVTLLGFYAARTVVRNADWTDRETLFRVTAQASPNAIRPNKNYAICLLNRGAYANAAAIFKRLVWLDPDDPELMRHLGYAYYRDGKTTEGLELILAAHRRKPDYLQPYIDLGIIYGQQSDFQQSLHYLEEAALKLDQPSAALYYNLAITYRELGFRAKEKLYYWKALGIDPDHQDALRSLAALYWDEGKWAVALQCYQKLLTINPHDEEARYWMEEARRRLRTP
jgi:Flp pilus assembly protein TadD